MNASAYRPLHRAALHLAIVTETYPPEINGVARTIGAVVETLHARGHRIALIRPRQHPADQGDLNRDIETLLQAGVPLPMYPDLRIGLPCTRALIDAWRKSRPDVVQVVTEGPLGASALKAARKLAIPTVSEFRTHFDSYSKHYRLGLFKPVVSAYLRRFHNRSDRTLVPTPQLQAQLSAAGYRELRVIGRGIDLRSFDRTRRDQRLRALWRAEAEDVVAIYVGRLAPEKNFRLFVRAVRAMQAVAPRLRVVVVGDGPERQAMAAANADFIFTGRRSGADLAAHYASADVFLFPSETETFGNVTTEAMASGLAIVAFDYAAARKHLRHEESALLAPYDDADDFVACAQRLATDAALCTRLRDAAAKDAQALGWTTVVEELEGIFDELRASARARDRKTREREPCGA
jgi:glycosyltransferase involved in cell wall biosynthesis